MAIKFVSRPDCSYKFDYNKIFRDIALGNIPMRETFRSLIMNDLFFIVHIVMGIEIANCPFVVKWCREVEDGPDDYVLDIWAREHFKSTIITVAQTAQYHLRYPDHCTGIFGYKKPAAEDFLKSIKSLYEMDFMKACFPDRLYASPDTEAPCWSLQRGITIKRPNSSRKESTVEGWGLIEGMPTGRHFERRVYDDVETADIADNPDQLDKCFSRFEMSDNLGKIGGTHRIVGTFYSHLGPLVRIRDKQWPDGRPMYQTRIVPATDDGTSEGKPVLVTHERLEQLKMGQHFNSQQLCDPTPGSAAPLHDEFLREVEPDDLPPNLWKFLIIDPAGDKETQTTGVDPWAISLFGVEPAADEIGQANTYLLDLEVEQMGHSQAIDTAVRMYLRGGIIMALGVEKVGQSTAEIHVANALKVHGRFVSTENDSLVIFKPSTQIKKATRIVEHIEWPLNNSKMHYLSTIRKVYIERLRREMTKFPLWHDDILDTWAWLYELIKTFNFPSVNYNNQKPLNQPKIGAV